MKTYISILIITATFFSCKNIKNNNTSNIVWLDTLNECKDEMKKSWLERYHPNTFANFHLEESYNLPSHGDDVNKYDLLIAENFAISYRNLVSWTPNIPIEEVLTLRKDRADGFLANGKKFIFSATFKCNNNVWHTSSYGPIFKQIADSLSSLYFTKK